jgi:hypothetical protein
MEGGDMRAARCIVPLSCARSPVSYPRSGVPNRIHASGFTTAPRVVTIPIVFMGQFSSRVEGTLSRPLARTANKIIVRGDARPVVAVAHRIGHPRQLTPTAMYAADGSGGCTMHCVPTSAESETTGLEEIGGSTGAESKRSKIFAV